MDDGACPVFLGDEVLLAVGGRGVDFPSSPVVEDEEECDAVAERAVTQSSLGIAEAEVPEVSFAAGVFTCPQSLLASESFPMSQLFA